MSTNKVSSTHSTETFTITGRISFETPKAVHIIPDSSMELVDTEHEKGMWFPFSQIKEIHKGSVLGDGVGNDRLVVTAWIAKTKGLV